MTYVKHFNYKKRCPKCKETKRQSDFYRANGKGDGYQTYCKKCQYRGSGTRKALYVKREELAKQGLRDCTGCKRELPFSEFFKGRNHDGMTSRCRECVKVDYDPIVKRNGRLLRRYGITVEQYQSLLGEQDGVCAGCLRPPEVSKDGVLCVDHDHACCPGGRACGNCVRGLLCDDCNTSLGKLQDDPETLLRLARYVQRGPDLRVCVVEGVA